MALSRSLAIVRVVAVLAALFVALLGVGVCVLRFSVYPTIRNADARIEGRSITAAAEHYRSRSPNQACPTLAQLQREPEVACDSALDPWRREFRVECVGDGVRARSAGEDGAFDTADDVVVVSTASAPK